MRVLSIARRVAVRRVAVRRVAVRRVAVRRVAVGAVAAGVVGAATMALSLTPPRPTHVAMVCPIENEVQCILHPPCGSRIGGMHCD